jgi:tRNA(Arg) A34 adenosine deaminase TadA
MLLAVRDAQKGIRRGEGGPFGACIVKRRKVLALGHNRVLATNNPTLHAEVCAIGAASRKLGTPFLTGCEIYSTTEPCPMCFSAIHWARIPRVYYGTAIADVQKLGFNELCISNATLKRLGKSPMRLVRGFCRDVCLDLLRSWKRLPSAKTY